MSSKSIETTRAMKDSGVEWIGEIPIEWEVHRVKMFYDIIGGSGFPEILQGRDCGDFPFLKASDINGLDKFVSTANNYVLIEDVRVNRFKVVPVNSIIMAKIGEAMKKNHRKINLVECIVDNNLQALRLTSTSLLHEFAYHYWKCVDMAWYDNNGTVPCLNNKLLLNSSIPIPPLHEQQIIATYLDEQVGKLDNLISEQKQGIEKWKAYKQSLITETVTKGLNPTAEMKDSGIEWIGEIPKTWGLPLLGTHFKERSEKVNDKDFPPLSVTKKGVVPQLENVAKTDNNDNRKKICVNDFVINSRSDRKGSSGLSKYEGSTSNISIVLQLKDIFPMYAHYLLKSQGFTEEFYRWGSGIVADLWSTRYSSMKKINIPLPPLHEQQAIADYLDEKCSKIDETIEQKELLIKQLEEYKQSLIYECVTGKREVH